MTRNPTIDVPVGIDRRTFLRRAGATVVAGALGSVVLDTFSPLGTSAFAWTGDTLPLGTPILVVIDLQGGNDGLNTYVPIDNAFYYDAAVGHGAIAISPSDALAITGDVHHGLNPNLTWLASRVNGTGDVAFIEGVGENIKHDFSHFASAYYRNSASFLPGVTTGWLGRFNDARQPGSPFASVSTSGLHPALTGAKTPVLSVRDASSFQFSVDWRWAFGTSFLDNFQGLGALKGAPDMTGAAAGAIKNTFAAVSTVSSAFQQSYVSGFEDNWLAFQLSQAAMLIDAGVPSQTYVAQLSPFDTHGDEVSAQGPLLASLDAALGHFFNLIDSTSRQDDVFVLIGSEFGRKVTANSSAGTDHGQAGLALMIGGGVNGGHYGTAPTLDPGGPTSPNRLDDALVPTMDFRSMYATALNRLAGDANLTQDILGGSFEDLGVFT